MANQFIDREGLIIDYERLIPCLLLIISGTVNWFNTKLIVFSFDFEF
jgi:hypothetical protein